MDSVIATASGGRDKGGDAEAHLSPDEKAVSADETLIRALNALTLVMQSRPAGDPVATTVPDGNVPVLLDMAPAVETLPIQSQPVDDPLAMNITDNSPPVFFDMVPFGDGVLSQPADNGDGIATVHDADLLPGLHIPDSHRPIGSSGHDVLPVERERDG